MKKLIFLITALVFLPFSAAAFSDISKNHKNYEAIKWAKESGIIRGYHDGTFAPEKKISRAEFLKIIYEAKKTQINQKISSSSGKKPETQSSISECGEFSKYTNSTYHFDFCIPKLWWWYHVGKTDEAKFRTEFYTKNPKDEGATPIAFLDLREEELERGYKQSKDGSFFVFFPRNDKTHFVVYGDGIYAQELIQIAKYMEVADTSVVGQIPTNETVEQSTSLPLCNLNEYSFPDVDPEKWYAEYICQAKRDGVVSGYANGDFRPNEKISFVAAAKVVAKIFSQKEILEDSEQWYKNFVQYLKDHNAVPTTVTQKEQLITRSEMIEIVEKIVKKYEQEKQQKNEKIPETDTSEVIDSLTEVVESTENISEEEDVELEISDAPSYVISDSGDTVSYAGKTITLSGAAEDFEILTNNEKYDAKDAEFFYKNGKRKTCQDPNAGYANYTYCIIDGKIFYDDEELKNVDLETFEILESNESQVLMFEYARDREKVYFQEKLIPDADPETFQKSNLKGFHTDNAFVYSEGMKLQVTQKEEEGDVVAVEEKHFILSHKLDRIESTPYLMDKNGIYCPLGKNKYRQLSFDVITFSWQGGISEVSGYAKDKKNVYFNCDRIEGADAKTFRFIGQDEDGKLLAKDAHSNYEDGKISSESENESEEEELGESLLYQGDIAEEIELTERYGKKIEVPEEEKPEQVENPKYEIHDDAVYFGNILLPEANSTNFEILAEDFEGDAYGRDEQRFFKNELIILEREVPEEVLGE